MRNDLSASEKRLIAALDRIDRSIDRAAARGAAAQGAVESELSEALAQARAENQRLSQELVALHEAQAQTLASCESRLAEAHQRLVASGHEVARLASANEALVAANRALMQPGDKADDALHAALQAEIDSLRASRAAEQARLGDMIDTLDRMVGTPRGLNPLSGEGEDKAAAVPAVPHVPMPPDPAALAEAIAEHVAIDHRPETAQKD
ncbi:MULTISPECIES: hypothetical protein [unclassified Paracoccus (in: a-proteobacteria)]|uniref:hypothetical protein n=1 Tax=unclassified Paracoccus (in: a-proteobacteria) TaxID=2688777 RepID=UPI0018A6C83B|nr:MULTISPECIES: hypothetical protein [unclassified Paracoccus (in: a-proteobacteria)]UXU74007.1 hypothetical protein GB879_008740 [Paracoccus sp. SMMA_5]UXU79895.1 hypothetical protein GB880_008720 [Paracoccus sp. SMMA_5_TC]